MNNRYTLPIAAAVALHTSLLFGFRHPAPTTATGGKPTLPSPHTLNVVPIEEVPDPSDRSPGPKGTTSDDPVKLPETPAPLVDRIFIISPPPVSRSAASDPTLFDLSPPGVPSGDIFATSTANIFSAVGLDKTPAANLQAAPVYPFAAKQAGLNGEVTVEFLVDETGHVSNPSVVRSSNPIFDEPSLRAVLKWRFEPGRRDGRVVRFRMAVPVVFRLNES